MQLRKVLKARGHFPSDEAAIKLIYLVLRDINKKWKNPPSSSFAVVTPYFSAMARLAERQLLPKSSRALRRGAPELLNSCNS